MAVAPTKILIVEDELLVGESLAADLQDMGYVIEGPVSTGEEALRTAATARPDLVLMDINIRGSCDGVEAAEQLRRLLSVPVVYLSAHTDPATLSRAKLTNPLGFVPKPYTDRSVQMAIEIGLYQHQAERRLDAYRRDLEDANARLELLATTDGLTGLKNRRVFQERLAHELKRLGRTRQPVSLVMFDVDHFKKYNDSFGHPAGDEVLRRVGRIFQEGLRGTDLAARYGGEEFAAILPNTNADGATTIAERLRRAIAGAEWPLRAVTVSVGVSTADASGCEERTILAAADGALYQSKSEGRNRVTFGAIETSAPKSINTEPAAQNLACTVGP